MNAFREAHRHLLPGASLDALAPVSSWSSQTESCIANGQIMVATCALAGAANQAQSAGLWAEIASRHGVGGGVELLQLERAHKDLLQALAYVETTIARLTGVDEEAIAQGDRDASARLTEAALSRGQTIASAMYDGRAA